MRSTTSIGVPPATLAKIESLARKWKVSSKDVLEAIVGNEATWQAILTSGRLERLARENGRKPKDPVVFVPCHLSARRCPQGFYWRGMRRCGCVPLEFGQPTDN